MTRDEVRALLAYAAASTRDWAPTSVDVDVWLDLLSDLPYDDTLAALRQHAATSPYRPAPADLRAGVKRLHADRLDRTPDAVPDADPDDPTGYLEALREDRWRTATGQHRAPVAALGRVFPQLPAADSPDLGPRNAPSLTGLPPVDDPNRLAQARAELAAREPIPVPDTTS